MLEILRDSLEFLDQVPELARQRLGSLFHAVVDVVLDSITAARCPWARFRRAAISGNVCVIEDPYGLILSP
jgi:hypothetical protein